VCGSHAARVLEVTDRSRSAHGQGKTFAVRICRVCGHVGNPDNTFDYRLYQQLDSLTEAGRIGTPEHQGREYHMARMALEILGRDDVEVLVYGVGRSFDNHHIAALPQVRHVAIADVMRLRDDAEFIDSNAPAPRRFAVVVASEVIEHFVDPRHDIARLLDYVEPDGLLVCSTNIYDGGNLAKQAYLYVNGHVSYYTIGSLTRLAAANDRLIDVRIPLVATGYGGPRKRYALMTGSPAVRAAIDRYFQDRPYAPSESPTANERLATTPVDAPD
jgi:SAM-dependent methyltransferase